MSQTEQVFEDYDSKGLKRRSCDHMKRPHRAHRWNHLIEGEVHCWGRNPLPKDAEERFCTEGCACEHCTDVRNGIWPSFVMCSQRWAALPYDERMMISESMDD